MGKTLTGMGLEVCLPEWANCQALKTNAAKTMLIIAVRVASIILACSCEFLLLLLAMTSIERGTG